MLTIRAMIRSIMHGPASFRVVAYRPRMNAGLPMCYSGRFADALCWYANGMKSLLAMSDVHWYFESWASREAVATEDHPVRRPLRLLTEETLEELERDMYDEFAPDDEPCVINRRDVELYCLKERLEHEGDEGKQELKSQVDAFRSSMDSSVLFVYLQISDDADEWLYAFDEEWFTRRLVGDVLGVPIQIDARARYRAHIRHWFELLPCEGEPIRQPPFTHRVID